MTRTQAVFLVIAALASGGAGLFLPPRAAAARTPPDPHDEADGRQVTTEAHVVSCNCAKPGGRFEGPGTRR